MTIAVGILASDGVVLAADTQETSGYFKGHGLKIDSAMTQTAIHSTLRSAVGVTGAGPGVYLDAVSHEIIQRFHQHQDTTLAAFEGHLKESLGEFYAMHVTPLQPYIDRQFELIVGAQIENHHALWVTEATAVKPSPGFEAVGSGHPFARMAIQRRTVHVNVQGAATLAIMGAMQAREYDQDCGKSTTVTILKDNRTHTVDWYLIEEAEKLFDKYAGIDHSAFLYAIGIESLDEGKRTRRLTQGLRSLRKDFLRLASQFP
jgi:hypothetical protein